MAFENPIVAGEELVISGIRSDNFEESLTGWRIGRDGTAQFSSINLLGDFGATGDISGDSFHVGPSGLWLPDGSNVIDLVDEMNVNQNRDGNVPNGPLGPMGVVAYYEDSSNSFGTMPATESGVIATRFREKPYRMYRVSWGARLTPSVKTDSWLLRARWTRDNTIPTTSSTAFRDAVAGAAATSGDTSMYPSFIHRSGNNDDIMWIGLFLLRAQGTGTTAFSSNASNRIFILVEDLGPESGGASPGEWSLRVDEADYTPSYGSSYQAPTTPTTPTTTYNKTYQPTWSRTYDGDNTTTFDDSAHCYQGYFSADRGNTRSLVGYNYTAIQADLAGATINSIKLTFKVAHAYYNAGMTVQIGKHDYTSKGSTWVAAQVDERQTSLASCKAGSTYTKTLPSAFGTEFKSGVTRGIAFGPSASNTLTEYGYLYGATETGKPYLTINYTK